MTGKSWQRITLIFVAMVAWIGLLDLPVRVQGTDPSWQLPLGYFFRNRFQAGVDYIFTYGPLGYFLPTESYDPHLYWLKYIWEIAIKAVFVAVLWKICESLPRFRDRLLLLLVAALFPPLLPQLHDTLYIAFLFAGSLCLSGFAFGMLCGLLALTKFNLLLLGFFLTALVAIHRRSFAVIIVFAGTWIGLWLALGQSLTNIPLYLSRSWEIAEGYGEAMALPGPPIEIGLALVVVVLLADASRLSPWHVVVALGGATLLSFKHAFVRHDPTHAAGFFVFAALAFGTLHARRWLQTSGIVVSLLALVLYRGSAESARLLVDHWAGQAVALVRPVTWEKILDLGYINIEKRYALPQICEKIGTGSVDVMGLRADQRIAILNNLRWHPRPVFEAYSAYTPQLLEINARFYQGNQAPEFVIVAWRGLDLKLPAANDGAVLLELLARYEPVEGEKHLFRRSVTPDQQTATSESVKEIQMGERLEVGPSEIAKFEINYSLLGRIRNFFYKPAFAFVHLTLASGEERIYRCVPAIVASKFLLTPLIENLDDIVGLYSPGEKKIVTGLEIFADKTWFQPKVKVTLSNFALPECPPPPESRSE
jgi:hypothetical protein